MLVPTRPSSPDEFVEDLDISKLAEYLHMTPDQVTKMAVRGKVPARRVGGQWRFSEAEIHHWLEERIGLSDPDQLEKVEKVLDRAAEKSDGSSVGNESLSQLCSLRTIQVPLTSRTRGSVIRTMCGLAAESGFLWDAAAMTDAVMQREQLHPTALDCGVALLHPRRPQTSILSDSVVALGIAPTGLPFSDRGQLTDVFFLICSYNDSAHLRILAKLSRFVSQSDFLEKLRASGDAKEAWGVIADAEAAEEE